mgnify:CR=1 FL=1
MDPAGLRKLEEEMKALHDVQAQVQQLARQKQTLMTQQNENELVMKELELVKGDRPVYKLVGPVLVKQDLEEAKDTITKRLQYIQKQMAERDEQIQALVVKGAAHQKIVCFICFCCCCCCFFTRCLVCHRSGRCRELSCAGQSEKERSKRTRHNTCQRLVSATWQQRIA